MGGAASVAAAVARAKAESPWAADAKDDDDDDGYAGFSLARHGSTSSGGGGGGGGGDDAAAAQVMFVLVDDTSAAEFTVAASLTDTVRQQPKNTMPRILASAPHRVHVPHWCVLCCTATGSRRSCKAKQWSRVRSPPAARSCRGRVRCLVLPLHHTMVPSPPHTRSAWFVRDTAGRPLNLNEQLGELGIDNDVVLHMWQPQSRRSLAAAPQPQQPSASASSSGEYAQAFVMALNGPGLRL